MQEEKKLVPKLRFPEFVDEWENLLLTNLAKYIKSGRSKKDDGGYYNLYGSTGLIGRTNEPIEEGEYILIARVGANAGQINYQKGEFGVSDNTLIISFRENIEVGFVKGFLVKFNLNRLIFGSGQPLVTGSLLKKI